VQAAIPFYGVYDFTNRTGAMGNEFITRFLEPLVMKAFISEEPERFAAASPMDRVHEGAPPFLVLHGDRDVLAPVADAREFVERLRAVSSQTVLYGELRGAQHAFDLFHSTRAAHAVRTVERFLAWTHDRAMEARAEAVSTTSDPAS
jgi:acetyl esterase/lipase